MENFKIRAYREDTNRSIIHENYYHFAERATAHYLTGASPYPSLQTISELMQKESGDHYDF